MLWVAGTSQGVTPATIITNSSFSDAYDWGIYYQANTNSATSPLISNNAISNVPNAIYLTGEISNTTATINSNNLTNLNGYGIYCENTLLNLDSNIISSNTGISVYCSNIPSNSIISNNQITNCEKGIILESVSPIISGNTITGNSNYPIEQRDNSLPTYSNNVISGNTYNGILITGNISEDGTWTSIANSTTVPYVIANDLTISSTHIIPAGTIIKIQDNWESYSGGYQYKRRFIVNGTLNIQGESGNEVIFTSLRDDTYGGDTNGDGTATVPTVGDWGYIKLTGSGNSIDHCIMQYGGLRDDSSGTGETWHNYMLWVAGGNLGTNTIAEITNCRFSKAFDKALVYSATSDYPTESNISNNLVFDSPNGFYFSGDLDNSVMQIQNNIIYNISDKGLHIDYLSSNSQITENSIYNCNYGIYINSGSPIIENNNLYLNTSYGLFNNSNTTINATTNWWGNDNGPYHENLNPNGLGNNISDNVNFVPWLVNGTTLSSGIIMGSISDSNGNPIQNVHVYNSDATFLNVYTDESGYYYESEIPFGNNYSIFAYKSGYELIEITGLDFTISEPIVNVDFLLSPITTIYDEIEFDEDTVFSSIDLNNVYFEEGSNLDFLFWDNNNISVSVINGSVTLSPNENWFGIETISFSIQNTDTYETIYYVLTINILPINDSPQINFPDLFSFYQGEVSIIDFSQYISDVDNQMDELTLSWSGNTEIVIEQTNWFIQFSASNETWTGNELITFFVDDNLSQNRIVLNRNLVSAEINVICGEFNGYPPASPVNVQITLSSNNVILNWDMVTQTINGTTCNVDYYLIFYSEIGEEEGQFYYHGFTDDTTYTHSGVLQNSEQMFYKIVSFVGDLRSVNRYLDGENNSIPTTINSDKIKKK